MTIEQYINLRDSGKEVENIKVEFSLSEATVLTFELGYTCYLHKVSLDTAIEHPSKIITIEPLAKLGNRDICKQVIKSLENEATNLQEYETSSTYVELLISDRLSKLDVELKKYHTLLCFL